MSISGDGNAINDINNMDLHTLVDKYFIILLNSVCDVMLVNPREKLDYYNTIDDVVNLINNSHNIVFVTGAGISTSCGIPDFRSKNGLYNMVSSLGLNLPDPQCVFDKKYFSEDPKPFFLVSKLLFESEQSHIPSITHKFMALTEKKNKLLKNYTQVF